MSVLWAVVVIGVAWVGAAVVAVGLVLWAARRYRHKHYPRVGGTATLGRSVRVSSAPHRARKAARR